MPLVRPPPVFVSVDSKGIIRPASGLFSYRFVSVDSTGVSWRRQPSCKPQPDVYETPDKSGGGFGFDVALGDGGEEAG